jgi:hypothetical protein
MRGVPVAPNVRAKYASYFLHQQYFSKAPGFMLPIVERKARLRARRKRKARLTRPRMARKRKARLIRLRLARKRKARLVRSRVARKRKARLIRSRLARKRKVNSFLGESIRTNRGLDKVNSFIFTKKLCKVPDDDILDALVAAVTAYLGEKRAFLLR